MTNKLLNSRLDAVFSTDPAVALWTYVKSIWNTATGYTTVPDYGVASGSITKIKFDTKFGQAKGFQNYWIVENMPNLVKPQILGASRYVYEDVKRVQIFCIGPNSKNTKWLMERHTDSLINGNPTGMQATYGIDTIQISNFQDIPVEEPDSEVSNLQPNKFYKARSFATVTLKYEQYSTTA